jgi:aspartate dehydrogenase
MKKFGKELRIALIGFGAIAEEIVRCLDMRGDTAALLGVLDLPQRMHEVQSKAAGRFKAVDRIDALIALDPDIVIECAGHDGLKQFGPDVLAQGIDLMTASVGALADRDFASRIASAVREDAQIWIPSGAVAGLDGLLAARTAGLQRVLYTSIKPPIAWDGTPAESLLTGPARWERTVIFEASAREAAIQYPQNANVAAAVAFAGIGLDSTRVKLVSDPALEGPLGIIEADGEFGTFRFEILAYASPLNPKTSILAAHSMVMAFREGICFSALPMLAES